MVLVTFLYFNAPEGCRHGTHTNGTAYILYQLLLHTRHLLESTHTNTYISSWLEVSLRTFARPRGPP